MGSWHGPLSWDGQCRITTRESFWRALSQATPEGKPLFELLLQSSPAIGEPIWPIRPHTQCAEMAPCHALGFVGPLGGRPHVNLQAH